MAEPNEPLVYEPGTPFPGVVGRTVDQSKPAWPATPRPPAGAPNVVLFVLDDVGYAQLSPFGGACEMPTLDRLAGAGLRYNNFHATALCSPTRASLLTGRNHHAVGMSSLSELALGFPGHHSTIGPEHAFLPAALRQSGYNTFAVGKWHLASPTEWSAAGPFRTWPLGRGFERFYGFMSGDTDQWYPDLVQDNAAVDPPYAPEDGYHLNKDLAHHAIQFIKDAHVAAPDKPFFLYYATGAGHAPHHVEAEWIDRYRGRFDAGWDAYRDDALAAQKRLGLQPDHVELSDRDPDVVAWDSLTADAKRMSARQMETFAGFLSQTDSHFGRVLDFIDQLGELDNTIVVAISDNGASAEGGPEGTFNEALFFNLVPERLEDNLERFDKWGGVETFPHYSWGWTWAGNTPFRRWKRETYRGGVSLPCIVSWPARLGDHAGGIRTQYAHVIDLAATVLDATGIGEAAKVDGIEQEPLDGVSLVPTFEDAAAPEVRTTQYFEMNGHRSIYQDGWRAVCPFEAPSLTEAQERGRPFRFTPLNASMLAELDTEWELYNVVDDPPERMNLAMKEPELLEKMVERWYAEAEKYKVLPIAGFAERVLGRLSDIGPSRKQFKFLPGASPMPFTLTPRLCGTAHTITADVEIPESGQAEGILLAQGNRRVGFAFYLLDGRLHHVHNFVGLEWFTVSSPDPVPSGRHEVRYEFEPTGPPVEPFNGKGMPGRSKLYVDGELVAVAELPYTVVVMLGFYGMTCGYDTAGAVDPSRWDSRFECTASIREVVLDVSPTLSTDEEALVHSLIAQQ